MYLYDAQTGKMHRVESALTNRELKALGYAEPELNFLQKICYTLEGLDRYSEAEALHAQELRLSYAAKLLLRSGVVLDMRTTISPVLSDVAPQPRMVFAKFRYRSAMNTHQLDYRYLVAPAAFDEPEFGSLDGL